MIDHPCKILQSAETTSYGEQPVLSTCNECAVQQILHTPPELICVSVDHIRLNSTKTSHKRAISLFLIYRNLIPLPTLLTSPFILSNRAKTTDGNSSRVKHSLKHRRSFLVWLIQEFIVLWPCLSLADTGIYLYYDRVLVWLIQEFNCIMTVSSTWHLNSRVLYLLKLYMSLSDSNKYCTSHTLFYTLCNVQLHLVCFILRDETKYFVFAFSNFCENFWLKYVKMTKILNSRKSTIDKFITKMQNLRAHMKQSMKRFCATILMAWNFGRFREIISFRQYSRKSLGFPLANNVLYSRQMNSKDTVCKV
jgi:hypothetical protein